MNPPLAPLAAEECLSPPALAQLQRRKLAHLIETILPANTFYQAKLQHLRFDPLTDPLDKLPFTTRQEIEADQATHPPYGTNLTYPLAHYTRLHQTSGTSGCPVRWLDTPDSWNWFKECWAIIYAAAGIAKNDRFLFPFSFGPFIGFWAAFESALAMNSLTLAAGGLSTTARLKMILDNNITVIGCTPTYALRMAQVAAEEKIDLAHSSVRALVVAGEPGGSIPATRQKIESAFGARLFDHTGMTEIGSLGFECLHSPGNVHLIESQCIPEVIDPVTGQLLPDNTPGELVLTNLGRLGSPLLRYRTGDRVTLSRARCPCGRTFARMLGGIQGRIDDMIVIRGNNVFPSALEALLQQFPEVAEFQIEIVEAPHTLTQITLHIEPLPAAPAPVTATLPARIAQRIQDALNFHAQVTLVPPNTLPRPEMKSRRIIRKTVPR